MNNFFDISSVVIIWASLTKGKIGNELLNNLRDFEGQKFWVNPKGWEYEGIEIFPHILDLPIIPDVAVFTIPASGVIKSLIECWKKGIKRAVIISAGFKETGNKKWEDNSWRRSETGIALWLRVSKTTCPSFMWLYESVWRWIIFNYR